MGFEEIYNAALLSQCNSIGNEILALISCSKPCSQTNSATLVAMLLYSTSAEVLEMVFCFLDFHETRDSPILMQKTVTDFLDTTHEAQSASQKELILSDILLLINKPKPGCPLISLLHVLLHHNEIVWEYA